MYIKITSKITIKLEQLQLETTRLTYHYTCQLHILADYV